MGDEGKTSSGTLGENTEPTTNQDELILAQQRQIEKEISEAIPLVGEPDSIISLSSEYSTDEVYLAKVKDLASKYTYIRRTRPDGNCFFRAFSYATLERLLSDKEEFNKFYKLAENSKNVLVELGFQQFTVEDFYETYMEVLKRLAEIENVDEAKKELHTIFNEQGYSDYMVVYLRLLTSAQLQKEQDFYSCFIEGDRTIVDFCHQEVEPMYKDSDHIHIMAACSALNTGVRVLYMDRGTGTNVTQHDLPEGCTPTVHLLYRPSHYDILVKVLELPRSRTLKSTPGAFLKYLKPKSSGSYCKLNFGLPTQLVYTSQNLSGSPEFKQDSRFRILYNVIEGQLGNEDPGVTYVTQLTKEFTLYLAEVVRYWEGAVSVAVYVPDGDPKNILENMLHFCYCIPQMSKLSLHLVFKKDLEPSFYLSTQMPPQRCGIPDVTTTTLLDNSNNSRDPRSHDLDNWYPINVCRNAAREAAITEFVLVSDIELIPSKGLASRFIDMTESYKCDVPNCRKRIFVVPVFEVESGEELPRNKNQLVDLMRSHKVVYFHQLTCMHCQKFPGLEQWKESEPGDIIKPLLETKRETPYHRWEPIYIGTKNEPIYSEKLSWEGFQDKMLQMYEMCLDGYKVVVLDGAFLVHWPGIKTAKRKDEPWRVPYVKKNQEVYNELLEKISKKYRINPRCGEQKPN